MSTLELSSKLPNIGTSIFTYMTGLANQYQAINLSQGFPEFDAPQRLKQGLAKYCELGFNQYAPSSGLAPLQTQIASLIERQYAIDVNPHATITVTSGATEALFVAIQAITHPGDEIIIFDPAYDSYEPAIELAGGRAVHIAMQAPDYAINWQQVAAAISDNTSGIIINTPHNPSAKILKQADFDELKALVIKHDLLIISDEVYEHITFGNTPHISVLGDAELFSRAFVISSFGKTFHCTGWKMGYCVAPRMLTQEFRKIHQYVTFSSFTPAQLALTDMLAEEPEHITALAPFYQKKRDMLVNALQDSRFTILPSEGTYFLLLDYSEISTLDDMSFCEYLVKEIGVAAIPLSVFYQTAPADKIIRLCFAKEDKTLQQAAEKLSAL